MLVKICGITSMQDAEAAVDAGAAALGFVFWGRSPRYIDPHRARAIVASLPPFVVPVGVFVNQPAAHVRGVAALVRVGAVQLHGDEDLLYVAGMDWPVIKAVSIDRADESDQIDIWPRRTTLLLDVHDPVNRGGTGRTIDWSVAATIAARRRTLLAGGLTPDNVAEAVARVQPFGIDVSSGVERSPGVKDHARIRALFEALRDAAERKTLRTRIQ
ncbi:MAG TPA: phosphoribosylanthranilate isomerase [Vicinamibacterales bacterium]